MSVNYQEMGADKNCTKYMLEAIRLSCENIKDGGGPFGAVIVKGDEIIATGVNSVTRDLDPTAHAEVNAIRKAAQVLEDFDLSGCVIYSSCEPCPMCLAAIYWARISRIYYGNSKKDAADIHFDDAFFYDELKRSPGRRNVQMRQCLADEAHVAFKMWEDYEDKIVY